MDDLERLLADARARLGGVARERLGVLRAPRVLGIARAERIAPVASAWHLGVLLLTEDAVYGTGEIVRAADHGRRGYTAATQRRRGELALAALRGGFAEGETVHVGWSDAAPGEEGSPLVRRGEAWLVRWSPRAAPVPLRPYLDERVALALDPPRGASA